MLELSLLEGSDDGVGHFFQLFVALQALQQLLLAVGSVVVSVVVSWVGFVLFILGRGVEEAVHGTAVEQIKIFHNGL